MAFVAADVIAKVREEIPSFYPTGTDVDATPETEGQAVSILNDVHAEIVTQCGLYMHTTLDVPFVAGVREYAFDGDVYGVVAGSYVQGPGSSLPMRQTSVDRLDYEVPGWRDFGTRGSPFQYYLQGAAIGFWTTPNVTTVGGYPFARLTVLERSALTSLASPLPAQVPTLDAWVFGVCLRWCVRNDRAALELYAPLASRALGKLRDHVQARLLRDKPSVQPRYPRVGRS